MLTTITLTRLSIENISLFSSLVYFHVPWQGELSVPEIADVQQEQASALRSHLVRAEVYSVSGLVCEEQGHRGSTEDAVRVCYQRADVFFRLAFTAARMAVEEGGVDVGYLIRQYQQYMLLLHARTDFTQGLTGDVEHTIIATLQDAIWQLQKQAFLPLPR